MVLQLCMLVYQIAELLQAVHCVFCCLCAFELLFMQCADALLAIASLVIFWVNHRAAFFSHVSTLSDIANGTATNNKLTKSASFIQRCSCKSSVPALCLSVVQGCTLRD